MLKLVNDTAYLTNNQIRSMFSEYSQLVFDDAPDIQIVRDSEGTFPQDPEGVYVTDAADAVHRYGGAAYVFGAATIYDVAGTLRRLGRFRGMQVVRLRIFHEILHHYNLDSDCIEQWFIHEHHPVLSALYHTFGRSSGETPIGCWVQEQYYRFLLSTIDVRDLEFDYRISKRTYQGLI